MVLGVFFFSLFQRGIIFIVFVHTTRERNCGSGICKIPNYGNWNLNTLNTYLRPMYRRRSGLKKCPWVILFGVEARMSNSFTSLAFNVLFWLSKIAAAPVRKQWNIKYKQVVRCYCVTSYLPIPFYQLTFYFFLLIKHWVIYFFTFLLHVYV